jgi:hypothetical protein
MQRPGSVFAVARRLRPELMMIATMAEAPSPDDRETDPTGRFMRTLLIEAAGLQAHEINDVLFTNAVMCLPARRNDRHPASVKQMDAC